MALLAGWGCSSKPAQTPEKVTVEDLAQQFK